LGKGILGLVLLNRMPKTYEVMDDLYKDPTIEEDKIPEKIRTIIKQNFLERWEENKTKLFVYCILNALCLLIDFVIFIVQLVMFGNRNYFLMQITLLFIIIVFFVSDVVYFLWFVTLRFTFPSEIVQPINSALYGSFMDLKEMLFKMFTRNPGSSSNPGQV